MIFTQIEGAPSPKSRVSSLIIAVGLPKFELLFDEITDHGRVGSCVHLPRPMRV